MAIKVKDLPARDRTSEDRTAPDGSKYILLGHPMFLHCRVCGGEFSATRGDYFLADPDQIMRHCGRPMQLVTALGGHRAHRNACRRNANTPPRQCGVSEYRMACTRCGRVRWCAIDGLGTPHCLGGAFAFLRQAFRWAR